MVSVPTRSFDSNRVDGRVSIKKKGVGNVESNQNPARDSASLRCSLARIRKRLKANGGSRPRRFRRRVELERRDLLVSASGYLIQDIAKSNLLAPAIVERGFWFQFYFQTERGRAGLDAHRRDIPEIMWHDNSPTWTFGKALFEGSAPSFDNPDYSDVVVHFYRHRRRGIPATPNSRRASRPRQ